MAIKMKKICLTCFWIFTLFATHGQNCLGFVWQINKGDSSSWHSADFIPHKWNRVNIGISFERQGYSCFSGYYTLWNQVTIPAKYKNAAYGNLQLGFRFEAEKTEVFFNGTLIGKSKKPGSEELFDIPKNLVRWSKPNYVLVRICNSFYTGGTWASYIHITPAVLKSDVILDASFANRQHVYTNVSNIHFRTTAAIKDKQRLHGIQRATIVSDFHDTVFAKTLNISTSSGSKQTDYSVGKLAPGFYQLQLDFSGDGMQTQKIYWFAVDPEKIKVPAIDQQTVGDFWNAAKKELATIDPQFKLIKVDSLCTTKNNVYIVEMRSLENIIVRGWYIVPARAGVYPAVAHFPGYGGVMQPRRFMNDTDIVHLALDIRGHGISADVIKPGFNCPGYVGFNLDNPQKYIYRGAYMDCCRALDFLLSRSEVDPDRIAVAGHSQGGGLSLATSALCADKVKYCITGSPFLSDFTDHVKIRSLYMDEMKYYMKNNNISYTQVVQTMNLVDNTNLSELIRCPVLMGVGLFDDDCPPRINFGAYNNIPSKKEYHILPNKGHNLGDEWHQYYTDWLRKKFGLK
jgi:cephalosporin-C deacetylase-like acetyl esterase